MEKKSWGVGNVSRETLFLPIYSYKYNNIGKRPNGGRWAAAGGGMFGRCAELLTFWGERLQ